MKKKLLAILFVFCLILSFFACDAADDITSTTAKGLAAPTGVRIEAGYVMWNPVEYAAKYTISIDGKEYFCDENKYSASDIRDGEHIIKVKANGDGILYSTSPYSEEFKVKLIEGSVAYEGYYSQFDELTMQESFLGYGFDVINSSQFYDKTVKLSYPIFKTNELMNLRFLKVDSARHDVYETQSDSIDTYMEKWNASLNVNVDWGGKKIGGSVDVNTKFSGGSSSAVSKYFHTITFNDQKFYIVMQGTTNEYRSIISEGFEQDLYSNMSPAELFDKYGTHFITSAVMGGKINSHYLYTSSEETDFAKISAAVSGEVRAIKVNVDAEIKGDYKNEATSNNVYINNMIDVLGGGDFAINSDTDIGKMYADWLKSLDDHPALIGIKDSGSLCPIWQLIDPAKDTRTDYEWTDLNGNSQKGSRAEQLQAYFMKYGVENYNILAQNSETTPIVQPESIENILINGNSSVNDVYEIYAGKANRINFSIYPDKAIGYKKTVRLNDENEYVTISADNSEIIVLPNISKEKSYFSLTVSAGNVSKTIFVQVVQTYNVDFRINLEGVELEKTDKYKNLRSGTQIPEPKLIGIPADKIFCGWYKDSRFLEKYTFGNDPIEQNTTLYAKWKNYTPEIKFITNIDSYSIESIFVNYGDKYEPDFTPSCAGYDFAGFYSDAALTRDFDFDAPIIRDIKIYLKWNPKVYTITFVADDIVVGTDTFTVEDKSINIPSVPKKTGLYGAWEKYTLGVENITVNAVYTYKPTYTVKFRDGENIVATINFNEDTMNSVVAPPTPVKKGYDSVWEPYTLSPVDIIVNVVYTPKTAYVATFCDSDGSILATRTFNADTIDEVVAPEIPNKIGYTRAWEDYVLTLSNISIYVVDTPIRYTITYVTNGALQDNSSVTYTVEDEILLPKLTDNSIYADYNYHLGWFYDAGCTEEFNEDDIANLLKNPEDITLYAKWDRCIVYNSINSTPWSPDDGRVIFDWRNDSNTDFSQSTRPLPDWAAGRNSDMDIYSGTTEIYIIGDPNKIYYNLRLYLANYVSDSTLTIHFINFNLKTNYHTILEDETEQLNVIIDVTGKCSLETTIGCTTIYLPSNNITFTGSGELTVNSSNGENAIKESDGKGGFYSIVSYRYIAGKAYELYNTEMNWEDAKVFAEFRGGYLVTITSEAENNIIREMIKFGNNSAYYIGAYRYVDDQNIWAWVTGEKFDYACWTDGEPNNNGSAEDYVGVRCSDRLWNDFPLSEAYGFIVEYDL